MPNRMMLKRSLKRRLPMMLSRTDIFSNTISDPSEIARSLINDEKVKWKALLKGGVPPPQREVSINSVKRRVVELLEQIHGRENLTIRHIAFGRQIRKDAINAIHTEARHIAFNPSYRSERFSNLVQMIAAVRMLNEFLIVNKPVRAWKG